MGATQVELGRRGRGGWMRLRCVLVLQWDFSAFEKSCEIRTLTLNLREMGGLDSNLVARGQEYGTITVEEK